MAITYSTNLALTLLGNGDQAGTWGATTNTNLGTLLEQSISGYVIQVMNPSSDVDLTATGIPNGVSGTARNMFLELTGTMTQVNSLIVPANKKLYYIYNNTVGGYAVTVKVASLTGVSVPNGKKMVLVSNGTDIVEAVTYTTSTSVGGTSGQLQYNNSGALGGSGLSYNSSFGSFSVAAAGTGVSFTVNGGSSGSAILVNGNSTQPGIKIAGGSLNPALVQLQDGQTGTRSWIIANGYTYSGSSVGTFSIYDLTSGLTPFQITGGTGAITLTGTVSGSAITAMFAAPGPIGGTTPNTGAFTTLTATSAVVGAATGGNQGAGTINATGLFINGVGVGTGSGSVTNVSGTGTVNGITLTGSVTTSGNLTLGGTLSGVSLSSQVTGTLPIANGGTGATDAATARANLGAGTGNGTVTSVSGTGSVNGLTLSGTVSSSGNITLGGTLSGVSLGSAVTGTLPIANGGTGNTTANAAINALLPSQSTNSGKYLTTDGTNTSWATVAGGGSGTVTSVSGTGTVSGISLSGTVTSSGSLTLGGTLNVNLGTSVSGTLAIANGGTGSTTAAGALSALGAYAATNPSGYTSNTGTVTSVSGTGSTNGLTLSGSVTSSGNITLGGSVTSVDTAATINGFTIGYRTVPRSTTTGTIATTDVGKCIAVSAGITVPNSTFAAGDIVSVYNDSASSITITATVATLRQAGTTNTGNRTLAARGLATIWFNSATEAIISGAGVT